MQPKLSAIGAVVGLLSCPACGPGGYKDWPSYNNTLTSERYSHARHHRLQERDGPQGAVQFRYRRTDVVSDRAGGGRGRSVRRHRARYLLDRPNTCKQNWRAHGRVRLGHSQGQSRSGRGWTAACFGEPRRPGHRLLPPRTASRCGRRHRGPGKGRVGAGLAHRLERTGVHRQRRRRQQGREGAYVCPGCQDRPHRVGVLHGAEGGRRCGARARGAGRRAEALRQPGKMPRAYPSRAARLGLRIRWIRCKGLLYVPGGNPAPDFAKASRPGENLFASSDRGARRQDRRLSKAFSAGEARLSRLGRIRPRRCCF